MHSAGPAPPPRLQNSTTLSTKSAAQLPSVSNGCLPAVPRLAIVIFGNFAVTDACQVELPIFLDGQILICATAALCDVVTMTGAFQVCCSQSAPGATCRSIESGGNICCATGKAAWPCLAGHDKVVTDIQRSLQHRSLFCLNCAPRPCGPCCRPMPAGRHLVQVLPRQLALQGCARL